MKNAYTIHTVRLQAHHAPKRLSDQISSGSNSELFEISGLFRSDRKTTISATAVVAVMYATIDDAKEGCGSISYDPHKK